MFDNNKADETIQKAYDALLKKLQKMTPKSIKLHKEVAIIKEDKSKLEQTLIDLEDDKEKLTKEINALKKEKI